MPQTKEQDGGADRTVNEGGLPDLNFFHEGNGASELHALRCV